MYIPPSYFFRPEEFFPPHIISQYKEANGYIMPSIWRLMDDRVLWTAVQLRKLFGVMIINDYTFGGNNENRGFRDFTTLIDTQKFFKTGKIIASWSSFTSQHCFGRAIDSKFKNLFAGEVRDYIIKHSSKEEFKFITAMEKEVTWLHFDVRNFKTKDERFFIF